MHIPVCRMFMSKCLGVSSSLKSIEAVAGVFVLLRTTETVLRLVAGSDFLVMVWEGEK